MQHHARLSIRSATAIDAGLVLRFIRDLAEYEKLSHEVVTDEASLRDALFGPGAVAEALIGEIATPRGPEAVRRCRRACRSSRPR